jgi:hypothetical protein
VRGIEDSDGAERPFHTVCSAAFANAAAVVREFER